METFHLVFYALPLVVILLGWESYDHRRKSSEAERGSWLSGFWFGLVLGALVVAIAWIGTH